MGRLENLLPIIKPGKFKTVGQESFYEMDDQKGASIPLKPNLLHFLELSKGSYSIKEICMFIYDKHSNFHFTEIFLALEKWSAIGLFKNSQDILDALRTKKDTNKVPVFTKPLSAEELSLHLRKVGLFSSLPPAIITTIVQASEQKIYKAGEVIIKKDTVGAESFILLSGSVGVYSGSGSDSQLLATLPPLSVFGESAAVSDKKRTADVIAMSDSLVVKVNLRKIIEPRESADLNKNLRVRLVFSQLMKTHPVFRNLPNEVFQMLLSSCRIEKSPAFKTVLQQGEKGQNFYFILSGTVHVVKDRMPEVRLSVGSYFGEVGALLKQNRTASVVTETDCVFLVLSERNFISLLASNFVLALEIEREITQRAVKAVPEFMENKDVEITEDITETLQVMEDYDFSSDPKE